MDRAAAERPLSAGEPILEARALEKTYRAPSAGVLGLLGLGRRGRQTRALKGVSFTVPRGSALGVVGRNGSGKSTLLRILAGLARPTGGTLVRRGSVGTLIDLGVGFHPDYTGRENLRFAARLLGVEGAALPELERGVEDFAGLGSALDAPLSTYSSGMAVRLGFSVATALRPDLLVVDEVLAVGDAAFQLRCYDRMESYLAGGGTLVLVSHDMSSIIRLCQRALWIDRGELRLDDAAIEVARAYHDRVIEEEVERSRTSESAALLELLQGSGEARIEGLELRVGDDERPAERLRSGARARLRVTFEVRAPIDTLSVAVTLYREDGLVAAQAISSADGLPLGPLPAGRYAVEVDYPALAIAPTVLRASVGLFPDVDPRNDGPRRRYDLRSRAWRIEVDGPPAGEGAYHAEARWIVRSGVGP